MRLACNNFLEYCYQCLVICNHAYLIGKMVVVNFSRPLSMPSTPNSTLLWNVSVLVRLLPVNAIGHSTAFWELQSSGTAFHPSVAEGLLLEQVPMHLSPGSVFVFHCRIPQLYSFWWCFWPCHITSGMCCSMPIHILLVIAYVVVHTLLQFVVRTFLSGLLCLKWMQL